MSFGKVKSEIFFELLVLCARKRKPAVMPQDLIDSRDEKTSVYIGKVPIYLQHLIVLSYKFYLKHVTEYDRHSRLVVYLIDECIDDYQDLIRNIQIIEEYTINGEVDSETLNDGAIQDSEKKNLSYESAELTLELFCNTKKSGRSVQCVRAFLNSTQLLRKSQAVDENVELTLKDLFPESRQYEKFIFASDWNLYVQKPSLMIAQESDQFARTYWYRFIEVSPM